MKNNNEKNVIITGATGMVGSIVLRRCLAEQSIKQVTSLVRNPSEERHPKLKEVVIDDFCDYSSYDELFKDQNIAYFCLGVYSGAVPAKDFEEITVNYTKEFAKALKQGSSKAAFCFLSGAGADSKEKSKIMFARIKGVAENFLLSLGFGAVHVFRPGYIYPVKKRKEPSFSYVISRKLYPLLKVLAPSFVISSEELAKAIFYVGFNGGEKDIYENVDIKEIKYA